MVAEMIPSNEDAKRQLAIDRLIAGMKAMEVVQAKAMLKEVKAAVAKVEAEFTEFMVGRSDPTVELADGTLVTLIEAERRNIDAGILADVLPKSVFDTVTDAKVNHKRFDAAAETGLLAGFDIESAVSETPYTAIRVTKS